MSKIEIIYTIYAVKISEQENDLNNAKNLCIFVLCNVIFLLFGFAFYMQCRVRNMINEQEILDKIRRKNEKIIKRGTYIIETEQLCL